MGMSTKPTVLLAEDSEAIRSLVLAVLRGEGHTILVAEDGDQAIELLESHIGKIDILLSDIFMPGMNGLELAKRIRGIRPDIHVILMSAHSPELLSLDLNWHFMQKPFPPKALVEKINQLCG